MIKFSLSLIGLIFIGLQTGFSQTDIRFELEGYEESYMAIANNLLDNQYIVDTIYTNDEGQFVYQPEEAMPPGIYLAVIAPNNEFFQFLVTDEEQAFTISTKVGELVDAAEIEGSRENQLFYDYLSYLSDAGKQNRELNEELADSTISQARRMEIDQQLQALDGQVKDHQQSLLEAHPDSYLAVIIKGNEGANPPEFTEIEDDQKRGLKRLYWMREHFFDNLDLKDPRLLRTPFLFQKVDFFVNRLHSRAPDTLVQAIDQVLSKMDTESETFKFYLIHYLNEAANSEFVGMDAIYVHLIDKYYANGMAPWTDAEQLGKFLDNANRLRPLLVGKIAPDIRMKRRDGTEISLHEVESPYTVLYFWRYDCGHCKESTPFMKEFYDKWKTMGVELFAVCAKTAEEVGECWEYIDEHDIGSWLHTIDPYLQSRYAVLYDLQTTPQIYVLDENKEILSKRIGAEQLDELMGLILEERANEGR
ncbi:MAG: redoxin domain-containing protein [Bacteroidota bacterium]